HAYLSLFFALAANSSRSASTERPTPLTHTLSLHDALPISETPPDFTGAVSHFLLIRRLVNTNRTTRWIVHFLERFIPFDRFSGRTRDGRTARHALSGARKREQFFKDLPIQVRFFRGRRVVREAEAGSVQLLIRNLLCRHFFQGVDPTVTDAIGELLFLPPGHACGQIRLKTFTQDVFFHLAVTAHFILWVNTHRHIKEFFVEERNACFHAPG